MPVGLLSLGYTPPSGNAGVTINVPGSGSSITLMNMVKNGGFSTGPANFYSLLDASGYPTSVPGSAITFTIPVDNTYYGQHCIKFTGTGSFHASTGGPFIVYSGGAAVTEMGGSAFGVATGANLNIIGKANPNVVFATGMTFDTVQDNGSGKVQIVTATANGFNAMATGQLVQINNVSNWPAGTYSITKISATTIDILAVNYSASYVPATGNPGSKAELLIQKTNQWSCDFPATGPYTSMSDLIFCQIADIDGSNPNGLQAGYEVKQQLIDQLVELNPPFLRMLDMCACIGSLAVTLDQRPQKTDLFYSATKFYSPCYAGTVTNGGSDAYTCSNPSTSGVGAYADGEIVQGQIDSAGVNTTAAPTLNVGGRGAAPIFQQGMTPYYFSIATPEVGDQIEFTFQGDYFNGGAPYVYTYTLVSGDTNVVTLAARIQTALDGDATLTAANIMPSNGTSAVITNQGFYYTINALNGGSPAPTTFTIVKLGTGTTTVVHGTQPLGAITSSSYRTFVYVSLLGGWVMSPAGFGLNAAAPLETQCEMSNRVGCGFWAEFPLMFNQAAVEDFITIIADSGNGGLDVGLPLKVELSNEVWNFIQFQTPHAMALSASLGMPTQNQNQYHDFYGLRVAQIMPIAKAQWIAEGRTAGDFSSILAAQESFGLSSATQTKRMDGTNLNPASNAVLAAYGGLGMTSMSTNHSAAPNRPIDLVDDFGVADYWFGSILTTQARGSAGWQGAISNATSILQAGLDYANGNVASAFQKVYEDCWNGGSGSPGFQTTQNIIDHIDGAANTWYPIVSGYDAARAAFSPAKAPLNVSYYEGGKQVAFGNDAPPDYNYTGSDLAAQMVGLGWDVSAYTVSGTNDRTECANQVVALWVAFAKSIAEPHSLKTLTIAKYEGLRDAYPGRTMMPAQYNYEGPGVWPLVNTFGDNEKSSDYYAIVAYNQ